MTHLPGKSRVATGGWPHRLAVLLVCATFPLIWVGGLVTTYDAGLAVPDWPGTYGYNLFLYPWQTWLSGPFDLFIEHGHRLLGAAVGLIAIAVVGAVWYCRSPAVVRAVAAATLAGVMLQGLLGGLRVIAQEVQLAKLHGIVGPAFFALTVGLAAVTAPWWTAAGSAAFHPGASKLHRLAVLTAGLVFLQLVVGAHLRHLPPDWSPGAFRATVFFHLLLAAALVVHVVLLTLRVARHHRGVGALHAPSAALLLLLLVQIGLGCATWVVSYAWPDVLHRFQFAADHTVYAGSFAQAVIVTAHQATGSLILATATLLALRAMRLVPAAPRPLSNSTLLGVLA